MGWEKIPVLGHHQEDEPVDEAMPAGLTSVPAWALAAAAVETDAARAAVEQRCTEMALQHADAVGDGGRCDLKFLGGAYEVLVPCGSVEEAEAIERWQGLHGAPQHTSLFCH